MSADLEEVVMSVLFVCCRVWLVMSVLFVCCRVWW